MAIVLVVEWESWLDLREMQMWGKGGRGERGSRSLVVA